MYSFNCGEDNKQCNDTYIFISWGILWVIFVHRAMFQAMYEWNAYKIDF